MKWVKTLCIQKTVKTFPYLILHISKLISIMDLHYDEGQQIIT